MLRGEVSVRTAVLETLRRFRAALERRRERAELPQLRQQPARLQEEFARLSPEDLLAHFRSRRSPEFFPASRLEHSRRRPCSRLCFLTRRRSWPNQAKRIANEHCWALLGFGEKCVRRGAKLIGTSIHSLVTTGRSRITRKST